MRVFTIRSRLVRKRIIVIFSLLLKSNILQPLLNGQVRLACFTLLLVSEKAHLFINFLLNNLLFRLSSNVVDSFENLTHLLRAGTLHYYLSCTCFFDFDAGKLLDYCCFILIRFSHGWLAFRSAALSFTRVFLVYFYLLVHFENTTSFNELVR